MSEKMSASLAALMSVSSLLGYKPAAALDHLARLINTADDSGDIAGLHRAIDLSESLPASALIAEQVALLHYFLANAWAGIHRLSHAGKNSAWDWERSSVEQQIVHLRSALSSEGFDLLHGLRRCQIHTNLGNSLSHIGRFVEAIEHYDRALRINPNFAMARGNRGYALVHYARQLEHSCHQQPFIKQARADPTQALEGELDAGAKRLFEEVLRHTGAHSPESIDADRLDDASQVKAKISQRSARSRTSSRQSRDEVEYRRWCSEQRLFLHPLNDLECPPVTSGDVLTMPSVVVAIEDVRLHYGYFNQIKQEFVSARYSFYEGVAADRPHYSDRDVLLFNTYDYPSYSFAVERVKIAFRVSYSLFDKVAFFLNDYLSLAIPERQVSFRAFWYTSQDRKKGLRADLRQRQNWALRGLFWLSKDLYEDKAGFKEAVEPEAREWSLIRNHVEHKYFKLHEFGAPPQTATGDSFFSDPLAFSVGREEFEAKTLRLLKIVRSTLIYLSAVVHTEEQHRARERGDADVLPGMFLDVWHDEDKT